MGGNLIVIYGMRKKSKNDKTLNNHFFRRSSPLVHLSCCFFTFRFCVCVRVWLVFIPTHLHRIDDFLCLHIFSECLSRSLYIDIRIPIFSREKKTNFKKQEQQQQRKKRTIHVQWFVFIHFFFL